MLSTDTLHQASVDFPDKPERHWKLFKPSEAIVHGVDIVQNFFGVIRPGWIEYLSLNLKNVPE